MKSLIRMGSLFLILLLMLTILSSCLKQESPKRIEITLNNALINNKTAAHKTDDPINSDNPIDSTIDSTIEATDSVGSITSQPSINIPVPTPDTKPTETLPEESNKFEVIWDNGDGARAYYQHSLQLAFYSKNPLPINAERFYENASYTSNITSSNGDSMGTIYSVDCPTLDVAEVYFEQAILRSTILMGYDENPSISLYYSELFKPTLADPPDISLSIVPDEYSLFIDKNGRFGSGIDSKRKSIYVYKSTVNGLEAVIYTTNYDQYVCAWIMHENLSYTIIIHTRDFSHMENIVDSFIVP